MRLNQWPDGSPIKVFVLEDATMQHISFCKQLLGMFPYQLRRIWDRQVFSGTGVEPTTLKNHQEMLDKVSQDKGAIGYVHSAEVIPSVKILEISL